MKLYEIWICGSRDVVQTKNFTDAQQDFLSGALAALLFGGAEVWWSGTIYAILKEGIMGNIHIKLYEIWIRGSRDVVQTKNFTDARRTDDGQDGSK